MPQSDSGSLNQVLKETSFYWNVGGWDLPYMPTLISPSTADCASPRSANKEIYVASSLRLRYFKTRARLCTSIRSARPLCVSREFDSRCCHKLRIWCVSNAAWDSDDPVSFSFRPNSLMIRCRFTAWIPALLAFLRSRIRCIVSTCLPWSARAAPLAAGRSASKDSCVVTFGTAPKSSSKSASLRPGRKCSGLAPSAYCGGGEYHKSSAFKTVRCSRHPWYRASPDDGPARGEPRIGSAALATAASAADCRPARTLLRFRRALTLAADSLAIADAENERDEEAPAVATTVRHLQGCHTPLELTLSDSCSNA